MKRTLACISACSFIACLAAPVAAEPWIFITPPSGTFGNDAVTCAGAPPCAFSNTFNFTTPSGYNLVGATISSIMTGGPETDLDFTSVTLNGVEFSNIISDGSEFRNLFNQPISQGASNVLVVQGTSGGGASYAGTLSFAFVNAVPEPATWTMMIGGFALVGASLRRRRPVRRSTGFA